MIRVVLFLTVVCLVALGFAWVADRPGEVAVTWLGYKVETSLIVAAVAVVVLAIIIMLAWTLVRMVLRAPRRATEGLRNRRRRQGFAAISRGLIAIGSGDARAARKSAGEAARIAPAEPLALLLRAQSAQLHGDRAGAQAAFREMAGHAETRLIGLRGLYIEARRRDDPTAARLFAEEAARRAPALPWAGQAVLEFRCAEGDWEGALKVLDRNMQSGLLDRATYRRHRAVLMTARAIALADTDRDTARALAIDALRLAPDLVPAAALAGRLLADAGETRKAGKILEAEWRLNPHPDLAEIYAHLRLADSARERLARVETLARQPAGHVEGALALARAALDAREFATARAALAPLAAEPTQRVALLMAELEEVEHGDVGRAREWMARALRAARDPAWTADGYVSDRWLPISPVTGQIDAFQWRVPLAELAGPKPVPVIEQAPAAVIAASPAPAEPEVAPPPAEVAHAEVEAPPAPAPARPEPSVSRPAAPAARSIIPLIPIPDDPGPDAEPEAEPESDPGHAGRRGPGWLFR